MPMDPSGLYRVTPGPPADSRAPLYLTRHQSRTVADSLLTTANALVDSAHRKRGIYATDDDHRVINPEHHSFISRISDSVLEVQ